MAELLQQTYAATAVFDFKTSGSAPEALDLNVLSDPFVGIGFDSLELQVVDKVHGSTLLSQTFSSPNAAETFFQENGNSLKLGAVGDGGQSIEIDFSLSYLNSTGITAGASFGFAYALVDPPALNAPEPSTWVMMLIGFAGLGLAGYRASRKTAALAASQGSR